MFFIRDIFTESFRAYLKIENRQVISCPAIPLSALNNAHAIRPLDQTQYGRAASFSSGQFNFCFDSFQGSLYVRAQMDFIYTLRQILMRFLLQEEQLPRASFCHSSSH